MRRYCVNKLQCKSCKDMLEFHFNDNDIYGIGQLVSCRCGVIQLDPAQIAYRIIGDE